MTHIQAQGWASFSLRQAAKDIGVSPGAAYKHFATLDDLLFAVSEDSFQVLDAHLKVGRRNATDPREGLIRVGMAYVEFAQENPNLFNLMFSDKTTQLFRSAYQRECHAADSKPLTEAIEAHFGRQTPKRLRELCDFFWVVVHGMAALEAAAGWKRTKAEKRAILEIGLSSLETHQPTRGHD